ncbi:MULTISPECIES: bifunctional diaminohydroxyphosphoribosylaminopyrimidine deaminase/5-amino-6-(5-phosphoribosylamino)uracil reductase RibD [Mammaliicoccus]|uniref:bifunctional diaminohydroxyphosphoribosylaminopyrimidine deaminase/5-amino-6-(5-phosphoribosylamino)uracil reductase RibD n=1 Tax=Mammaliicoccus TaxID=2803850 RepID=UPI0002F7084F|nr:MULTISPECIES: bifunctional diaminohydroxyphosphoribosylaminopyrimidine deaminase/5-amino-6-(5-phosphoribosylamino)uracil reductase RibD [Mammaliicoccus]HBV04076.1 bifunctional diaminohydroxyphosphoribosylaminopyrimidine deaminase/5-amino-6-(5-phosphoribosylamino)uracil reductase RibD [Staphylococcus sp.]MBF0750364.1 bifunctional diaminohydroxyphosphoribosylaminopyrimidine deaminase/5-amino-6-(5-phosphoribosylamino)uracil reductase RibD [Mammaliicoccus lentus]MBF0793654.1 bifunctional diaminoh
MNQYLEFAIQLAEQLKGQTSTNPSVGAVIVKDNRIIGFGAHLKKGEAHAEIQALNMAGKEAEGATIYVSLEPCSHYGLTPPCSKAIIESGISRVEYAVKDGSLSKSGHDMLEEAGVEVIHSPSSRAEELYKEFFIQQKKKTPFVTLKISTSLDGKVATDFKESKWITCKAVKEDVLHLRSENDAIITGGGTVREDNPLLTSRKPNFKEPKRIVLSQQSSFDEDLQIFKDRDNPAIVVTNHPNFEIKDTQNIELYKSDLSNLENMLQLLYKLGYASVLVEAGPTLVSQFIEQDLADQLIIYQAPKVIGGQGKYQFYQTNDVYPLSKIKQFKFISTEIIDEDLKLILRK